MTSSARSVTELCGLAPKGTDSAVGNNSGRAKPAVLVTAESWLFKLLDAAAMDRALFEVSGDLTSYAVAAVGWSEALQKYLLRLHPPDLEYLQMSYMSDWAIVGAIAHELGHVADFMRLNVKTLPGDGKRWELEADKFAGGLLRKIGCPYGALQFALQLFNAENDAYPSTAARISAMAEGWKSENASQVPPPTARITLAKSIWLTATCQITWKARSPQQHWPFYIAVNTRVTLIDANGESVLETGRTSTPGWMDLTVRCVPKRHLNQSDWRPSTGGLSIDAGKAQSEMEYVAEIPSIDLRRKDTLGTFLAPEKRFFASGDLARFDSLRIHFCDRDTSSAFAAVDTRAEGNLTLTLQLPNEPQNATKRPVLIQQEEYLRTWELQKDESGYVFVFANFLSSGDFRAAVGL